MTARIAIASVLVSLQTVIFALGGSSSQLALAVCSVYFLATIAVRIWAHPRPPTGSFDAQWVLTIGVDLLAFSLLDYQQAGGINYAPLFALPVLLASVLGPILLAFGTAATVTLLLLTNAWLNSLNGFGELSPRLLQAGLSGSGFFLVALLANQLAIHLALQELQAKASQSAARMQQLVSDLVIETLAEGVLVVDVQGVVRSLNPSCRKLLGVADMGQPAPFLLAKNPGWLPLADLMSRTFDTLSPQRSNVTLQLPDSSAKQLRIRTRLALSGTGSQDNLCVIFIQDLREMEARVRTEKMAAMGRMSAAVAHEIRNPLAAISQANALLEEDLHETAHRQLTAMVRQNAQRLAKIVDEVLNVSRVQEQLPSPESSSVLLDDTVLRVTRDWANQNAVGSRLRVLERAPATAAWFDPDHLRRLLINLLDNALRYASQDPQAIEVSTDVLSTQLRLAVWSDGVPLEKSVQTHLFEPFFSSESRSSGLGLYICRELCERYGAQIDYQRAVRGDVQGNEFFVLLRPAFVLQQSDTPLFDNLLTIC
ncbi:MAG: PAS domain-containing sensor histidine kinase [Polaromonas sp.]|nr:PAS domain-containing sensor histidine kinase [Polaromonas sp.]